MAEAVLDLERLRMITDGDVELEKQLFELFGDSLDRCIGQLRAAAEENKNELWKSAAHELKGASANLGATAIHVVAAEADRMKDSSKEEKASVLARLEEETVQLRAAIAQAIG